MNFTPRPVSKHYRARLIAWTLSMLMWLLQLICTGAVFSARHERQRNGRMSIEWLTRRVKLLIISRANDLAYTRMRRRMRFSYRGCRKLIKPGLVNAIIGVRVRRMLKRKSLFERIVTLIQALRRIDDYAALVAKRIRRGLCRRMLHLFALPPAPDAAIVTLALNEARFADSS